MIGAVGMSNSWYGLYLGNPEDHNFKLVLITYQENLAEWWEKECGNVVKKHENSLPDGPIPVVYRLHKMESRG